ncbi:unnamed protein product, partial [Staurois parvus]
SGATGGSPRAPGERAATHGVNSARQRALRHLARQWATESTWYRRAGTGSGHLDRPDWKQRASGHQGRSGLIGTRDQREPRHTGKAVGGLRVHRHDSGHQGHQAIGSSGSTAG